MRALFLVFLALLAVNNVAYAESEKPDKYGFLARDDQSLLDYAHDSKICAIILGCVYRFKPSKAQDMDASKSYVTVIESYKGDLKIGQKIVVGTFVEIPPTKEAEEGNLRFYFLQKVKNAGHNGIPANAFFCDWPDVLDYSLKRGEPLRKLLRDDSKKKVIR